MKHGMKHGYGGSMGKGGMSGKAMPAYGTNGVREAKSSTGKTVVKGSQGLRVHAPQSHGMGGMMRGKGSGYASPAPKAQIPAHLGGHDHTRGRRRGVGY